MWPFSKKKPQEVLPEYYKNWQYLGYTELWFTQTGSDETHHHFVVHFYAKGKDLEQRKIICGKESLLNQHGFKDKAIYPWIHDKTANLYTPIFTPSDWLKKHTKQTHGYDRVDGKWVKPAPKIEHQEENVITFPKK